MCDHCATDPVLATRCHDARVEALSRVYLFEDLPDELLELLLERSRERHCEADEWLCHCDGPADSFYLVRSGQIGLSRHSEQGDELIVALLGPGELFGEDTVFLDEARHPLAARAVGPSTVTSFDRRLMRGFLDREPRLAVKLLETLHRRNTILLEEMERLTVQSASDRLLTFLERQAAIAGPGAPLRFPKRVLASRLSMRPETLSRVLGRLKACHRLREVDGCLVLQEGGDDPDTCGTCPIRLWGCPGPRREPLGTPRSAPPVARGVRSSASA